MVYDADRAADVKSMLICKGFASAVLDQRKRSTICSLVAGEVARLTQSGRPIISPTSVLLTTGGRMVEWRIKEDCSLMVSVRTTSFLIAPSMSAQIAI